MSPRVISTNSASARPNAAKNYSHTGIEKLPQDSISVSAPGPNYGDGSGVAGDFVGDSKHHGGEDKAVYAFSREELNFWEKQLDKPLADGSFGENLTTQNIHLGGLVINQRVRVGTTILEVSVPRTPCLTFAAWLEVKDWTIKFTKRGRAGAYFSVIQPGVISPGDEIILENPPLHGITMADAFVTKMGNNDKLEEVVNAQCLPKHHHEQLKSRLERKKAK